ncbi:predicted protein [Plenodomus lingam JN3]|uniref:Uncharacterized protein n=1 Tax=Leptosphaeria maculans (strain JN3 / isolate v23.1.3 / race Av1-4-5-6-7-8) TaxID=985895 RepID=E4ZGG2_LEPMJ|nr:predicted protein [Plenodomus lingam JN3]CBX90382.1 predicted protein [Plenodomus lingam JN3]
MHTSPTGSMSSFGRSPLSAVSGSQAMDVSLALESRPQSLLCKVETLIETASSRKIGFDFVPRTNYARCTWLLLSPGSLAHRRKKKCRDHHNFRPCPLASSASSNLPFFLLAWQPKLPRPSPDLVQIPTGAQLSPPSSCVPSQAMYAVRYAISQQETPTAPVPSLFDRGRARVTTQHLLRHELRDAAFLTNRRHSTPRSRPSFPILLKHRHGTDICRHPTSTCRSLVCQKRAVRTWTLSPATWVQFCNPGLDSLLRNHGSSAAVSLAQIIPWQRPSGSLPAVATVEQSSQNGSTRCSTYGSLDPRPVTPRCAFPRGFHSPEFGLGLQCSVLSIVVTSSLETSTIWTVDLPLNILKRAYPEYIDLSFDATANATGPVSTTPWSTLTPTAAEHELTSCGTFA